MVTKIAFIGGGNACLNILRFIERLPSFEVAIITDLHRDAPAMRYASDRQLRVSTNPLDAIKYPELDVLFELTGKNEEVMKLIRDNIHPRTVVLDSRQAQFLFQIFSSIIENEFTKIEDRFMANIKDIKKSISDFAAITKNIDILAINASIEAARAGEAGKGFAVVASSIKDLVKNSRDTLNYVKSVLEKLTLIHKDMTETQKSLKAGHEEERDTKNY